MKVDFIGTLLDPVLMSSLLTEMDSWKMEPRKRSRHVAFLNAYCVALASVNPHLSEVYRDSDLAVPDGKPFAWWINSVSGYPCDRLAGAEAIAALAAHAEFSGHTFYLYGGHTEVVIKMKEELERMFPHIRILGYHSPPFRDLTYEEDERVCREIVALQPDVVLVGLGTPKQDFWILNHKDKIPYTTFWSVGAAFDFYGGRVSRAPAWISNSGFEWVYRLFGRDFLRLWKRYLVYHSIFLFKFFIQKVSEYKDKM